MIFTRTYQGICFHMVPGILSGIILSGILSDIYSDTLSSGCGPAVPTAILCWLLGSSDAHCDQELARREEEKL